MSSIKLLTCFFLCQFLFFSTRANNSESPDSKPNERAIFDEQAERLFVAQFSDWMENEKDVSKIISLKNTLQSQQDKLTGYKPIIGFNLNRNK